MRAAVSRNAGFLLVAYAFLVTMIGTTLPTPLYPLFEQRYSFGELTVTVVFAVYAFGVIAGLLAFGNVSDEIGRKPVLLLGLVFAAISALLFLVAGSLVPIYAGRVVSGLSAGIFTGTATAALVDLAPGGRRRLASFVAVIVNLGGLGLGTLLAGLLADYARSPMRTPFVVDLVLLVPAAIGLPLPPETVERRGETASSFFVVMYVGLSVPVIGVGVVANATSLKTAGIVFSAAVAVLVLVVLASLARSD